MSNVNQKPELDPDEKIALDAQKKQLIAIGDHHVEILKRVQRLEKLGGTLHYEESILQALEAYGGQIAMSFLSMALGDHALLTASRDKLVEQKKIEVIAFKNRKTLKLLQRGVQGEGEGEQQTEPQVPGSPTLPES